MKIGMIGIGGMGNIHIESWSKINDAKIVCACDISGEALQSVSKDSGIHVYKDLDIMLNNEEIDILDVCTPSYRHKEHALKALNRKINVICEKPACLNPEDVEDLYNAAEKNHVDLMIAHVVRFWPEYARLKKIFVENTYGKILDGYFWRMGRYPQWSTDNWMLDEAKSGLVPFDLQIHDLDFIVSMLGLPKSVTATRSYAGDDAVTDHFWANYHYENCDIKTEGAWFKCSYPFSFGFRVLFEKGLVEFSNNELVAYENGNETPIHIMNDAPKKKTGLNLPDTNAYDYEIAYFANCISNNTPVTMVNRQEICDVLSIIQSATKSAREFQTIEL